MFKLFLFLTVLIFNFPSALAMQVLSDDELGSTTGQSFFKIDRNENTNGLSYSKFTFGLDVDVSLNADLVELGKYQRAGESAPSDIRISDFALGTINADGSISPFKIKDPFFELAFEDVNGKQELVGLRLGFGESLGKLSGNIESLTGSLQVEVKGRAKPIRDEAGFFIRGLLSVAGIGDNTIMKTVSEAVLVDPVTGKPDPIRAVAVGVANGNSLDCVSGCGALSGVVKYLTADKCSVVGISTCFPLKNFRTLDVGQDGNPADGLFLSFQTKNVAWIDNGKTQMATKGAFMNIPNGGITVDFEQSFGGIERSRTKFVDPYYP